jgi:amino acid transporter
MDLRQLLSRLLPGVSVPIAVLLIIFFFLPWVEMDCGGMTVGEASGWDLTAGEMSMSSDMPEQMRQQQDEEQDEEGPDARPWFILGLIVPAALLLVGAMGAAGRLPTTFAGGGLIALGILGILVMVLAFHVDYAEEMAEDQPESPQGQTTGGDLGQQMGRQMQQNMAKQISTETTGIVATSLVFYILVFLLGAGCLILPMVLPERPEPMMTAGPPPAEPPPPPGSPPPPGV